MIDPGTSLDAMLHRGASCTVNVITHTHALALACGGDATVAAAYNCVHVCVRFTELHRKLRLDLQHAYSNNHALYGL
jgi:hypothetical protein